MTAPQALDRIIPGWTASLAGKPSPDFIISLLLKRRASLLTLVGAVLGTELLMKKRSNFRYDFAAHTALYHYVLQHTKAILLRARGWNAVALRITGAPRIAIIAGGAVVAALDEVGELHIDPSRCGTLNHLYADMRKAEETVLALMAKMKAPAPENTKETLAAFATELWKLARKAKIEGV